MDITETARRERVAEINSEAGDRAALVAQYGEVWDTDEMRAAFSVSGFGAPIVAVTRRSDGVRGSLEFQHAPRFYFNFQPV